MVAQCGTIKEASDRMFITSSCISKQIKSLEKELGVTLFILKNKKLHITYEGRLFYEKVAPFLEISDGLFKNFKDYALHADNRIVIGTHDSVTVKMLPLILGEFYKKRPDCKVVIKNYSKKEAIKALNESEVDCLLYPLVKSDIANNLQEIVSIPIKKYEEVLAVGKGHPLATKKNITLDDLQNTNFLVLKDNIAIPEFKDFVYNNYLKSILEIEGGTWEMLCSLVQSDIGITMLDAFYIKDKPHIINKGNSFFQTSTEYYFCCLNNNKKTVLNDIKLISENLFIK